MLRNGKPLDALAVELTAAGEIIQTRTAGVDAPSLVTLSRDGTDLGGADNQLEATDLQVRGEGDLRLVNTDDVTLERALTVDGSIVVTADGSIIAESAQTGNDTSGNDVTLTASRGDILIDLVAGGPLNGQVDLTASGDIREVDAVDPDYDLGAATINYDAGGTVFLNEGVAVDLEVAPAGVSASPDLILSVDGDITIDQIVTGIVDVTATGTITVTNLTAGGDTIQLNAGLDIRIDYLEGIPSGSIDLTAARAIFEVDAHDAAIDLIGNDVTLNAGLTVSGNGVSGGGQADLDLETQLRSLDASVASGSLALDEDDDIELGAIDVPQGSADVTAGGDVLVGLVSAPQGTVDITATGGSINDLQDDLSSDFAAAGTITLTARDEIGGMPTAGATNDTFGKLDLPAGAVVNASSTVAGDVVLRGLGALTLADVDTANGSIDVMAAGLINATDLVSSNDSDDNDIQLSTSGGDIAVGTINAGSLGEVSLTATGAITDDNGAATNVTADGLTVSAEGAVTLDTTVAGLGASSSVAGGIDIDESDDITLTSVTTQDGSITVTAGGTLTATSVDSSNTDDDANDVLLSTTSGDIAVGDVNAGPRGDVVLTAADAITDNNGAGTNVTADQLTASASGGITIDTTVAGLGASSSTTGDIAIDETDDITLTGVSVQGGSLTLIAGGAIADLGDLSVLANAAFSGTNITLGGAGEATNFGSLSFVASSGNVTVQEDSDTVITGANSLAGGGDLSLRSDGSLTDAAGATVSVGGNASFEATAITLGDDGATANFGTLTVTSTGAVTISEGSDTEFSGTTTADSLTLISAGDISDGAAGDITVTGHASFTADNASDTASIAIGDTLGNTANFGSLTIVSDADATINEASSTELTGTNSVGGSLTLSSNGSITDSAGSLFVAGSTSLDTGATPAEITLDDTTNDFGGSVTVVAGSTVTLVDANAIEIAAAAASDTLSVTATGAITDSGSISVTNNASFTGASITLGDAAAETSNFGSLTFNSANGAVAVSEDSATELTGTSTADSLTLISAGSITDAGSTSVTIDNGDASITGSSISLTDNAADTLSVSGTASFDAGAGAITIADAGTANFGSLTFQTTDGAIDITEDSATDLSGTNTGDSLTLVSAGSITDASGTSVTIDNGNASITGSSVSLADNAG